jgi:hypothetical protein
MEEELGMNVTSFLRDEDDEEDIFDCIESKQIAKGEDGSGDENENESLLVRYNTNSDVSL